VPTMSERREGRRSVGSNGHVHHRDRRGRGPGCWRTIRRDDVGKVLSTSSGWSKRQRLAREPSRSARARDHRPGTSGRRRGDGAIIGSARKACGHATLQASMQGPGGRQEHSAAEHRREAGRQRSPVEGVPTIGFSSAPGRQAHGGAVAASNRTRDIPTVRDHREALGTIDDGGTRTPLNITDRAEMGHSPPRMWCAHYLARSYPEVK
jgi:hypothetical protein